MENKKKRLLPYMLWWGTMVEGEVGPKKRTSRTISALMPLPERKPLTPLEKRELPGVYRARAKSAMIGGLELFTTTLKLIYRVF